MTYDTIVIGAGQAGLASAFYLKERGVNFLVLNAGPEPTGSWPSYYESLKLFSPAAYCSLPGKAFPGDADHYPVRDEVVAYLKNYAAAFEFPIQNNASVEDIRKDGDVYHVETAEGESFATRTVLAASGSFSTPYIPHLPGADQYAGSIIHAYEYVKPKDFEGQRVVVVGSGNSAVQIAVELAECATVSIASKRKIQFFPQTLLGKDMHFWLKLTGLDHLQILRDQSTPVMDTGEYKRAVKSGKPDRRKMFTEFTATGIRWADGSEEAIDTVLFATGYRANLPYLALLGLDDGLETKAIKNGVSATNPDIFFMGFSGLRSFSSATLRGVGRDADYVVGRIAKRIDHDEKKE